MITMYQYSKVLPRYIDNIHLMVTQTGWTPLMKASRKGHVDIVRIMIDAKAQVSTQEEVCCYYHTLHN